MSVNGLIRLQPFENLLTVLQNARTFADRNRRLGGKTSLIPFSVRIMRHIALRQSAVGKLEMLPVNIRLCHK